MNVSNLFFLTGSAPNDVRRPLLAVVAVSVVVAAATAWANAFAVLEPMLPLAFLPLWGARHGTFPATSGWLSPTGIGGQVTFLDEHHNVLGVVPPDASGTAVLSLDHRLWLGRPGRNGQAHRDNNMRKLLPDYTRRGGQVAQEYGRDWLAPYRNRWDLLKLGQPVAASVAAPEQ